MSRDPTRARCHVALRDLGGLVERDAILSLMSGYDNVVSSVLPGVIPNVACLIFYQYPVGKHAVCWCRRGSDLCLRRALVAIPSFRYVEYQPVRTWRR